MNHEQVMRQALEALEDPWAAGPEGVADAIIALRAALADGDKLSPGEPVTRLFGTLPVYDTPPQRKPLTEEQKLDLVTNWFSEDWAIKNALGLLDDYDTVRAHGIGE